MDPYMLNGLASYMVPHEYSDREDALQRAAKNGAARMAAAESLFWKWFWRSLAAVCLLLVSIAWFVRLTPAGWYACYGLFAAMFVGQAALGAQLWSRVKRKHAADDALASIPDEHRWCAMQERSLRRQVEQWQEARRLRTQYVPDRRGRMVERRDHRLSEGLEHEQRRLKETIAKLCKAEGAVARA